jgi:bacteriophage HK97-gp10 putative tail-component
VIETTITSRIAESKKRAHRAIEQAIKEASHDLVETEQMLAPVATGALRDSIHIENDDHGEPVVVVGAHYGAAINFGHHLKSGQFVGANPFWSVAISMHDNTVALKVMKALANK